MLFSEDEGDQVVGFSLLYELTTTQCRDSTFSDQLDGLVKDFAELKVEDITIKVRGVYRAFVHRYEL